MQNIAMGCGSNVLTLLRNLLSEIKCVLEINEDICHRSLHSVSHQGLPSTPLDAHRDGSMSAASFSNKYGTRIKLWPIIFQDATFPNKT